MFHNRTTKVRYYLIYLKFWDFVNFLMLFFDFFAGFQAFCSITKWTTFRFLDLRIFLAWLLPPWITRWCVILCIYFYNTTGHRLLEKKIFIVIVLFSIFYHRWDQEYPIPRNLLIICFSMKQVAIQIHSYKMLGVQAPLVLYVSIFRTWQKRSGPAGGRGIGRS